jgi:hypothetical protein
MLRGAVASAAGGLLVSAETASAAPHAEPSHMFAQRAMLTLPNLPVPGLNYSSRLDLFADESLTQPIGTGSASATVIDLLGTVPLVQTTLVLTCTGDQCEPAGLTLSCLFQRTTQYPRSYAGIVLGGYGRWLPPTSGPVTVTAHGPGNGDYLTIALPSDR